MTEGALSTKHLMDSEHTDKDAALRSAHSARPSSRAKNSNELFILKLEETKIAHKQILDQSAAFRRLASKISEMQT
jgi:hypothetical protein